MLVSSQVGGFVHIAASCFVLAACNLPSASPGEPEAGTIEVVHTLEQAPRWSVRYGQEFWRQTPGMTAVVDIGGTIERVTHAIDRPRRDGLPKVRASTFTATFDGRGLRFAPRGADDGGALHVRTTRIALGDDEVYGGEATPWSVLGNTAQSLRSTEVELVEHHEVRGEGVEVSWVLQRPVHRELVIDVALGGLSVNAETDHGVSLVGSDGTPQVRISAAELVDAQGQRWPIATELTERGVRYRVAPQLLASAVFPVALDPTISAELPLDAGALMPAWTNSPAVASNGSDYLIAWTTHDPEIRAARVSSTGTVLDPGGFTISAEASGPLVLASNGTSYLVAWMMNGLRGRRVSATGTLLDPDPIVITTTSAYSFDGASNGTDYMIAWTTSYTAPVQVTRVESTGSVHPPFALPGNAERASIASNGADFLVTWGELAFVDSDPVSRVRAARISTIGVLGTLEVMPQALSFREPKVGSDGDDYLVLWREAAGLEAARITTAGVQPRFTIAASAVAPPAITSDGDNYLVSWVDGRNTATGWDIYGTLVSSDGQVATPTAFSTLRNEETRPVAASNGSGFLLAWVHRPIKGAFGSSASRVLTLPLSNAGVAASPPQAILGTQPNQQWSPAVAHNGSIYLVTWQDERSELGTDIYGVRVSASTGVLDPAGILIADADDEQADPSVASDGSDFFVAWHDTRSASGPNGTRIYGARVSGAGAVLDPSGIQLSGASHFRPQVASNGTDYLVTWNNGGTVVSAAGAVLSAFNDTLPHGSLASDGIGYLQVYAQGGGTVSGRHITADGTVLPAFSIATVPGTQDRPAIASNGSGYVVVWVDRRVVTPGLYASRIVNGTATGETWIAPTYSSQTPVLGSNGTDYLVGWLRKDDTDYELHHVRFEDTGVLRCAPKQTTLLSHSEIGVSGQGLSIAGGGGSYLFAYHMLEGLAARLESGAIGATSPCDGSFECPAGFTVSGSSCVDVDECNLGTHECYQECTNTLGSYTCACSPGYVLQGNGYSCEDLNECRTGLGGCAQACANLIGGYACACDEGFQLADDGHGCVEDEQPELELDDASGGCQTTSSGSGLVTVLAAGLGIRRRRRPS